MSEKIIFLDRDGVINWDPIGDYIKCPDDFRFLPGVADALKALTEAKFRIVVISNQAGVGDGVFTEKALDRVNQRFLNEVKEVGSKIDHVFYCLHGKQAGCDCRKPEVGLFQKAEKTVGPFEKSATFYIGDKASDIEAGKRFGLKTIFVLTGHGTNEKSKLHKELYPDFITADLKEAVEVVLRGAA